MLRHQHNLIKADLSKKMVFLTGPRQVGKTWLAKSLMQDYKHPLYLNYDTPADLQIITKRSWARETDLIVFDEIHKMKKWKNYLKGLYDNKPETLHILVTGSARLDTFRHSGDSLVGRFFLHRLLPFALVELAKPTQSNEIRLMTQGGFPEPYLAANDDDADRWRMQYAQGLIRFDLLDFERVHDLRAVQATLDILRRSVGSAISYQSIAEDLSIAPNTVKKYIQIFEDLFIVFRVSPHSKSIRQSLKKEPKLYFYDTGMVVGDEGAKFENYVAVSLYKQLLMYEDKKGKEARLHYLKIKQGGEVDFCLVVNDEVLHIVEAKLSDRTLHRGLKYFSEKYKMRGYQVLGHGQVTPHELGDVKVMSSFEYLKAVPGL